jgi:hypothetical protein
VSTNRFNWQIWGGLLLSFMAVVSYPFVFVRWPLTRDVPWVSFLIFAGAGVLLIIGVRKAFAVGRRRSSKIAGAIAATFTLLFFGLFIFSFYVAARWLPPSHGAPQVGQKAPDFTLTDTNGKSVALSQLLTQPVDGKSPRGVLLIFYRGYW